MALNKIGDRIFFDGFGRKYHEFDLFGDDENEISQKEWYIQDGEQWYEALYNSDEGLFARFIPCRPPRFQR